MAKPKEFRVQVGDGFFKIMKGQPLLGRVFTPEEQVDGKDFVVVLAMVCATTLRRRPEYRGQDRPAQQSPYNIVGVMGQTSIRCRQLWFCRRANSTGPWGEIMTTRRATSGTCGHRAPQTRSNCGTGAQ